VSRAPASRNKVLLTLAALALLILAGAHLLRAQGEAPPALVPRAAAPLPFVESGEPRPPPPPAHPERGLRLLATLTTEGGPAPLAARVGAAHVRDEDLATWHEARAEGAPAPAAPLALANVSTWQEAPLTPGAPGAVRLGPVEVEAAVRHHVLAWAADGTAWEGERDAPEGASGVLDLGVLRPRAPTGVRLVLTGRGERGGLRVQLSRAPASEADAERAARTLPLLREARPELARALEGEAALPLVDGLVLAPLPPDAAVRITILAATGRASAPLDVPLREGRVEQVRLDLERLFPGGVGALVTLDGRVTLGTRPLPEGARLEQRSPPGPARALPPDGRFTLEGLPGWEPSRFTLRLPPLPAGRPLGPERWEFDFTPDGAQGRVARTWRAPAYGWLVLRLDGHARARLTAEARRPYPVYELERQGEDGAWRVEASDAFMEETEGVAVALVRPGVYRVLAAASPFDVVRSEPVRVRDPEGERSVVLGARAPGRECHVVVTAGGRPATGARVWASGGRGGLPPLRATTDATGSVALGVVRAPGPVLLEVESAGAEARAVDVTEACLSRGEAVVAL